MDTSPKLNMWCSKLFRSRRTAMPVKMLHSVQLLLKICSFGPMFDVSQGSLVRSEQILCGLARGTITETTFRF